MKNLLPALLLVLCFAQQARAQTGVSISTTNALPDASAMLDVTSTGKGILIPRMNTTQMAAIGTPATGLAVYNTDSASYCIYTGTGWVKMLTSATATTGGAVKYVGTSYLGQTSGAGGTGSSEGTGSNLYNIGIGDSALFSNTTGTGNFAAGKNALRMNTTNSNSVAIGDGALKSADFYGGTDYYGYNTSAIAIGKDALAASLYPGRNIAIGHQALMHATEEDANTAIGYQSQKFTAYTGSANNNTSVGSNSLAANTQGSQNTVVGSNALAGNTTGVANTAIGYGAGTIAGSSTVYNTTGQQNTFLGASSGGTSGSLSNATAIGYNATVAASNSLVLGNGANVGIGTSAPTEKLEVVGTTKMDALQVTGSAASSIDAGTYPLTIAGAIGSNIADQSQTTDNQWTDNQTATQTFTTGSGIGSNAYLTAIRIQVKGESPSGSPATFSVLDASDNVLSSQAATMNHSGNSGGAGQTITLTSPVAVAAGTTYKYKIALTNAPTGIYRLFYSTGNPYSDGQSSVNSTYDFHFISYIASYGTLAYFDGTNSRLGIGTASPTTALDVAGITRTTSLQVTSGATSGYVLTSDASGNATWAAAVASSSTTNALSSSGSSITSTVNGTAATLNIATAVTASETDPQVSATTTGRVPRWTGSALADGAMYDNGTNIGIGTTSPTKKLEVSGTAKADSIQAVNLRMTNGATSGYVLKSDASGNGSWASPAATGAVRLINDSYVGADAGPGNNGSSEGTGSFLKNVFIGKFTGEHASTGGRNISIGYGASSANTSGGSNVAVGDLSNNRDSIGAYNTAIGSQAMRYKYSGNYNVAVGNNALALNATGATNTALGTDAGKASSGSANVFLGYEAGYDETGDNKLYIDNSSSATPLIYGDFSTNRVTINDSLVSKYYQLTNGAANGYILKSDASGNASWVSPSTIAGSTPTWTQSGNDQYSALSGSVGIGTSSPGYKLHVSTSGQEVFHGQSSATSGTWLDLANTSTGGATWSAISTGSGNGEGAGKLLLRDGNDVRMTIQSTDGHVGIGTTSPGYLLHVSGAGNEVFYGESASGTGTWSRLQNTSTGGVTWSTISTGSGNGEGAGKMLIRDNSAVRMTIQSSDGAVGIGTTSPGSTLEINGAVAMKFQSGLVAGTTNPDATGEVWRYASGTGTITLPAAASCANRMYVIINQTGSTRNISTYRDLTTTPQTTFASSVALWLMSDGTNWYQIK